MVTRSLHHGPGWLIHIRRWTKKTIQPRRHRANRGFGGAEGQNRTVDTSLFRAVYVVFFLIFYKHPNSKIPDIHGLIDSCFSLRVSCAQQKRGT